VEAWRGPGALKVEKLQPTAALIACKALLLDMNGTFMFGQDRFGPSEDFFATYQALGGGALGAADVDKAIRLTHAGLSADYADPARLDDYPSLAEALGQHGGLPEHDLAALEQVFAAHELGAVPPAFAECLRRLAATRELGVVSNIWSRKPPWLRHFDEIGVADIWRTLVFSSDTRSMKPSPLLFHRAISELGLGPAEILFVGDSLTHDIVPAKSLGMATAWVGPSAMPHEAADWTGPSLLALETALSSRAG
jgi:HAD superfamily hydrolase (TIGR01509 family)